MAKNIYNIHRALAELAEHADTTGSPASVWVDTETDTTGVERVCKHANLNTGDTIQT